MAKPECSTVGDCGQLGIYGSDLICSKKGFCQNCSSDLDCNGVTAPDGKCIDNVCSCVNNTSCSCEGNDPYGCGYDRKGNCICSDKNKGLAALRIYQGNKITLSTVYLYLSIGFFLILLWNIFIIRFSGITDQVKSAEYLKNGSLLIGLIVIVALMV